MPVTFSIVICSYNYARYLGQAVASCLQQDYPAELYEIIVVDDGSTDGSAEVLEAIGPRSNLKVLRQANQGQAAAVFHGVSEAGMDYVCLLDCDDLFLPHKLRRVAEHIRRLGETPAQLFLCHDMEILDDAGGRRLAATWFQSIGLSTLWNDQGLATVSQPFPFANPCGQVFERKLLRRVLAAVPLSDWRVNADSPISHAAFLHTGRVHYLHEPLATYRIHGGNVTASIRDGRYVPRDQWRAIWPKQLSFLEAYGDMLGGGDLERAERFDYIKRQELAARAYGQVRGAVAPKISFIISTAEMRTWLGETLRSVQRQTYARIEVVLVGPEDLVGPLLDEPGNDDARRRPIGCLTEQDAGPTDQFLIGYRRCSGDYAVFVQAGDTLDPLFTERHLYVHQHVALCMVSASDIRLIDGRGAVIHSNWYHGSGRWQSRFEHLPGLGTPLGDWGLSPLSSTMFRRTRLLDCAVDYLESVRPSWLTGHGMWFLARCAQMLGGATRFVECHSGYRVRDGAEAVPQRLANPLPRFGDAVLPDYDAAAAALLEILCRNQALFRQVYPGPWLKRFVAWVLKDRPPGTEVRQMMIDAGCRPSDFGLPG